MDEAAKPRPTRPSNVERTVGAYGTGEGRTVVAIGSLHGNEPAGLEAIRGVLGGMRAGSIPLRGRFVGLIGNTAATAAGRRFVTRDLNRGWSESRIAAIAQPRPGQSEEDREQRELLQTLESLAAEAKGPLVVLDLHSTSGRGAPFSVTADLMRNRRLAVHLPVPTVLGLEEIIDGTLLGFMCDRGHEGIAVEGGQHTAPHTAPLLESIVWFSMELLGLLDGVHVPDRADRLGRLRASTLGLPSLLEIKHRHGVDPGDGFEMVPGFSNFVPVRKGASLASDQGGPIVAPRDGLLMLPRYQDEGDDGFFIARALHRPWLHVSALLRRGGLDRLLPLLPKLSAPAPNRLHWRGNRPPAPLLGALHLLGYRGARLAPGGLEFWRRT